MIFSMNFSSNTTDRIRERKMSMSSVGRARGRPIEKAMALTEYDFRAEEDVTSRPLDKWFEPIKTGE